MGATPAERAKEIASDIAQGHCTGNDGYGKGSDYGTLRAAIEAAILSAIREARADEREACAALIDNYRRDQPETMASSGLRFHLAAAVRARKAMTDQRAEWKRLAEYALAATKAITELTPGGGSECFGPRIGEMYTADLPYCVNTIRERAAKAHERWLDAERRAKEALARAEKAEARYLEEYATVDRVWKALGVNTYADAGGKEISEIVADWRVRAEKAEGENVRLREALTEIASFDDKGANERLERTGGYGAFDEPGSVQIARAALKEPSE